MSLTSIYLTLTDMHYYPTHAVAIVVLLILGFADVLWMSLDQTPKTAIISNDFTLAGQPILDGDNVRLPISRDGVKSVLVLKQVEFDAVSFLVAQQSGAMPQIADGQLGVQPEPRAEYAKFKTLSGTYTSSFEGYDDEYTLVVSPDKIEISSSVGTVAYAPDIIIMGASVFNSVAERDPNVGSRLHIDYADNSGFVSVGKDFRLTSVLAVLFILVLGVVIAVTTVIISKLRRRHLAVLAVQRQTIHAREEERKLLAAELHDGPVQELQYLARTIGSTHNAADQIPDVHEFLNGVSGTLRKICNELRPPVLTHFGIEAGLDWFSNQFMSRNAEIDVALNVDTDGVRIEPDTELALFRIVQESLTNISKHAEASQVLIDLTVDSDWIELTIRDNGGGFDVPRNFSKLAVDGHMGLLGVTQRAEAIGAAIDFQSERGVGTTVRLVAKQNSNVKPESRSKIKADVRSKIKADARSKIKADARSMIKSKSKLVLRPQAAPIKI